MKNLKEYLEEQINENLIQAVLSAGRKADGPSKVKIRPVKLKDQICYQASALEGTKVFHKNYDREQMLAYLEAELSGNFGQLQCQGALMDGVVLVSKKGKMTIKEKHHAVRENVQIQAHNRVKQYILKEGIPVPFLTDLGVMTEKGKIITSRYDKFRQINRFLEFIEDILPRLAKDREVTILDFGCGKSYLTFAMYYYLKELKGYDVNIIGLDLKTDVIEKCNGLARKYGYEKLHFYQGDIADYEGVSAVDMVVTLHACDTATDFALAKAVEWGAQVILSVPCCQHEVNKQIRNELLEPVLHYGILKERMSALITDAVRANLLESKGYETQILEFIDMEHTPKNLLIRAVKKGKTAQAENTAKTTRLDEMIKELNIHPTLEQLLYPESDKGGTL
ncbi:SAM-dependent methyltransferase [Ruminococcus sp. AF41-9]|mgnify:FL=1|nr:SAM-dependent methyltransferase [Ruminococcus sp. AF41-9]